MTPTEILMAEHRTIAKVLAVTASMADQLELDQPLDPGVFKDVINFFRIYTDRSHHGKEEDGLFPLMKKRKIHMKGGPTEILIAEHEKSRDLIAALTEAAEDYELGDPTAREDLITCLRGIVHLYPGHMWKEDYLLFPLIDKVFSQEDQEWLAQEFEKVDRKVGRERLLYLERAAELLVANHETPLGI
jgi:hemerythrin-like domain-containing protein